MAKIAQLSGVKIQWIFECPGCGRNHGIDDKWSFNGDINKPTINPSILVKSTKMTKQGEADYKKWCESGYPKREESFDYIPTICHSFVKEGKIQFLNDCTHSLACQTVELPDID